VERPSRGGNRITERMSRGLLWVGVMVERRANVEVIAIPTDDVS